MKSVTTSPEFQTYECINPDCGLRFSTDLSVRLIERCPRCGSVMQTSGERFTNFIRPPSSNLTPGFRLSLVLDNLRSALNVGSIFRTASGAGVKHIYCCGTTPTPDHRGVKKASLGAEDYIPWRHHPNCLLLVNEMKNTGEKICVLESTADSESLFSINDEIISGNCLTLVVGNEISGVDPQVLEQADISVHIPMAGAKTSINVAVAAGITLYWLFGNHQQMREKRLK
jgi:tRNA G18 (ribose-2'-O)-methylase SpoU